MKSPRFFALLALTLMVAIIVPSVSAISSTQDTDGDGIPDVVEDANGNGVVDPGESDPYNADSDGGGESDGSEEPANRNPLDTTDDLTYDADGDGWVNGIERLNNTDPKVADTDEDGVNDPQDPFPLDSKWFTDRNGNRLPDEWEASTGLDQLTIPQSVSDDPDADGLTHAEELARGTNPLSVDTDHDGVEDQTEIDQGTNPRENACLAYSKGTSVFGDMAGHWAEPFVNTLTNVSILPKNTPIIRGYDVEKNGKTHTIFAPDQPVTRYEFLKMVLLSTCTRLRTYTDREPVEFTDVRKTAVINENPDAEFRRYVIYTATHFGVVGGYPDGSFRPDETVARGEAMKILTLGANLNQSETLDITAIPFSDVLSSDWFYPFVTLAASREIVRGYGDGTFRPGDPITRAEAAKIIEMTIRQNPFINGYVLPEAADSE